MKLFLGLHLHFILRRRHVVLCYVGQLHVNTRAAASLPGFALLAATYNSQDVLTIWGHSPWHSARS
jgi:hypothetical protein